MGPVTAATGAEEAPPLPSADTPTSKQVPTSPSSSFPAAVRSPAPYPFLSPPQGPGELGWLGCYRVVKVLGRGGMGIVFHAEDTHLERPVALKVMQSDGAEDEARKRFLREARMMAQVRNDHIVTIHAVDMVNGVPFLAMELLHGETLSAWLQKGQRATPAQVVALGLQLARGLGAAHEKGLIHRDVKPGNIWLEAPSGRAKLLDFGLARRAKDAAHLTQTGTVMGTPAYMAPEQAEGGTVDVRCDMFSLGCVLYEYAAGEQAFDGLTPFAVLRTMAMRDPTPLHEVNPAIPPALSALVMRLMAKVPANRPASAAAVVAALEDLAATSPTLQPAPSGARPKAPTEARPRPPGRARAFGRGWWIAGMVGLAGALGMAFLLSGGTFPFRRAGEKGGRAPERSLAQGVSDEEVVLGMSGPFSGPARDLGRAMQTGTQTYFQQVNDEGGIAGRKLRLVALDDGYEPAGALANMRALNEEHKVFAVIGNVGTPTAEKALPYALEKRMLFFGAFTGADLLRRDPPDRYVFNYRASLAEETGAAVRYLIETCNIRAEQIAVFAQDDGYGDSGFRGAAKELRKYGRKRDDILRVGYRRNTLQVEQAVAAVVRREDIRAVVMVPVYGPATRFIQEVKDARGDVIFTSTSFVDSEALAEGLMQLGRKYAEGVIVTQVVPPVDSQASLVLRYRAMLKKYHPSEAPGSVSLEGYITAAIFVEGLRRAGDNLTTEALVEALESIQDLDIGIGTPIKFGPSAHQASHKVWGLQLERSGRYRAVELD
jgi:ABC-type branched-subunit amino acid transport system substrate-binding protein/predicted Ser/Thr protein kinase